MSVDPVVTITYATVYREAQRAEGVDGATDPTLRRAADEVGITVVDSGNGYDATIAVGDGDEGDSTRSHIESIDPRAAVDLTSGIERAHSGRTDWHDHEGIVAVFSVAVLVLFGVGCCYVNGSEKETNNDIRLKTNVDNL